MATSTISNPWRGTHRVDIGASLGKALKARKNGGEAGTSSPAPTTGPGKGRRNLPDREFYSLRYQHKPSSIDPRKPGRIQFNPTKEGSTTPSIVIEQASNQPNESVMFSGQEIALNKLDCVLIFDEDTGTFTLEKLDGGLKLSLDRNLQSIMPRESSPSSSTPSPGASNHAQPATQPSNGRRKPPPDQDTPNDVDDEIAALMSDTEPVPRSGKGKPTRSQKEEEEEEEEELPLLQQQRLQQEQHRKQREQQEQQDRAEAARKEQERLREQKQELLRLKRQHEQEKKDREEQEKRQREKEQQEQREREQLLREQEQRRLEQQQQEQQRPRYISTNKPKPKGPSKKKAPVNPFLPKPPPTNPSSSAPSTSSAARPLPKRPAEDHQDVEEFGSIVPQRPTKALKTKPSQTAASPAPPSSGGGLVLPGSSSSLSALAPEPVLPSSNSIQRYGPSSQKAKATPAPPPPPPPEVQEVEDSDDEDEGDWDEVTVPTNADPPLGVATPEASGPATVDDMVDEIFGDFLEEEDPNAFDLENELERGFEEAGLGPAMSAGEDSDEDMEPVSAGIPPMDESGPPLSMNQMLGLPQVDTDYSSSSDDDSDY